MTFGVAESSQDSANCAVHSPEVKAGAAELLKALQLPAADMPMVQQLATAKQVHCTPSHSNAAKASQLSSQLNQRCAYDHMQVLAEDVLPALKRASSSHPDSALAVDFACLPLGFSTGGTCSQPAVHSVFACHCSCSLGLVWPQHLLQRLS